MWMTFGQIPSHIDISLPEISLLLFYAATGFLCILTFIYRPFIIRTVFSIPYTLSNRCYFSSFRNFLIFFKKVLDFFIAVLYNRRAGCGWQPRKNGEIAQLARAHGSYPWCRGFESPSRYFNNCISVLALES